jgi:hypothetical protein
MFPSISVVRSIGFRRPRKLKLFFRNPMIPDDIVGIIWTNAGGCIIDGKIGLWLMYKNYGLTVGFK